MTRPFKYLIRGLIVNVAILFIASIFLVVSIARNYKGRCGVFWFFGGQGRPCPFLEYMREELAWSFILIVFELWWLILPAFAVIPVIAYLIGRLRNSLNSN